MRSTGLYSCLPFAQKQTFSVDLSAATRPCRVRVARTGAEIRPSVGSGRIVIHQKIGQSDLARMAGIARESVKRILSDWKRRKLIS